MRVLLLAFLAGCSGSATAPPVNGAAPPSDCPATAPADRSPCGKYLVKCNYNNEPRCPFSYCADVASQLVWITTFDHCAIACPAAKPAAGTPCSPVTSKACEYKGGDKCGFRSICTASGWKEEEITLCGGM